MRQLFSVALIAAAFMVVIAGCQPSATDEAPTNKKLTLKKPSDLTIKRGDTAQDTISIDRNNFRDPVSVTFENLPKGVTVQDQDHKIAASDSSAKFTFKAASDAELVTNHEAKATVTGPNGLKVTQPFNVTVKENK